MREALYELLAELTDDDPDRIAYGREPADYRHAALLNHARGDWAFTRRATLPVRDCRRGPPRRLRASTHEPLALLAGKMRREETYHLLHADAWLRRLAEAGPKTRDRLAAALRSLWPDAQHVFAPLTRRRSSCAIGAAARGRWRRSMANGRRRCAPCWSPSPASCPRRRHAQTAGRGVPTTSSGSMANSPSWLAGRGRCDVVTESAIDQRERRVWDELATIRDPEIPAINLVDLGVIGSVSVDDRRVEVELLPTFVGCPAIGVMQEQITERVGALGLADEVDGAPQLRPALDERTDHAGRARAAAAERVRAAARRTFAGRGCRPSRGAGRPADRGVPVLRLAQHDPREPIRPHPVPGDLPLRRLPPAVRAVQARSDAAGPMRYPSGAWRSTLTKSPRTRPRP